MSWTSRNLKFTLTKRRKMENEIIRLSSRDGTDNRLLHVGENSYILATPLSYGVGFEDDKILYIDPSGGPFLQPGVFVGNKKKVKSLRYAKMVLIELEDE